MRWNCSCVKGCLVYIAGDMMSATSLRSHGKIESGPAALCILSSESNLWIYKIC